MKILDWLNGVTKEDKLFQYCKKSRNDKIEKYLKNGAKPNSFDIDGYVPLHYTTHAGNLDGTRLVIDYGANLFTNCQKGYSPMDLITSKQYLGHMNEALDRQGHTALMYCALTGDKKNAQKLLLNDCDYTKRNSDGFTAYQLALKREHMRTAQVIRGNLKSVITFKKPHTVMRDVWVEKQKIVLEMVDKPIYKTVQEPYQEFEGGIIYSNGQPQQVGRYVTKYRDKRVISRYEQVPEERTVTYKVKEKRPFTEYKWEKASIIGKKELYTDDLKKLKTILSWGVDPNYKDKEKNKNTPLHYAAMKKNEEAIKELIHYGAKQNYRNDKGNTALHLSIEKGFRRISELLISSGANVNAQNDEGFTPLHIAVRNENKDMVNFLLRKGAKIDIKSKKGLTPLDISKGEIVKIMSKLTNDNKKNTKLTMGK